MFEHADRDDAVEMAADVAVVDQLEGRILRLAALDCPVLGEVELCLRQRDARYFRAANLRQIERKTAPAAADVEHVRAWLEQKLGSEVTLFGELGVVERDIRRREITAAVLLVAVEKERIEPAVEIVMVRDVAPGTKPRIELLQSPKQEAG